MAFAAASGSMVLLSPNDIAFAAVPTRGISTYACVWTELVTREPARDAARKSRLAAYTLHSRPTTRVAAGAAPPSMVATASASGSATAAAGKVSNMRTAHCAGLRTRCITASSISVSACCS